ncbi:hypothetical protein [Acidovorax cavernicola]|uniref:Uncharacterized protein n=1 Tax=Acidovorax cavernicola TaxID=1675792 RepID=A0A9X8D842_9BURK|nr:hypothetical protein [Acidovorax cavernicola]RIX84103.1 hypothetical protein D3H34_05160 [Acidovorax cavernicola]
MVDEALLQGEALAFFLAGGGARDDQLGELAGREAELDLDRVGPAVALQAAVRPCGRQAQEEEARQDEGGEEAAALHVAGGQGHVAACHHTRSG